MIPYLSMSDTIIKPKKSYELYMLLSPASFDGDVSGVEEAVGKILQKHGAQIERSDRFTKKDLAYNIQKFGYAYAASVYFFAPTESIEEITTELNTSDIEFLRILITKAQKRPKISTKPRRTKPKQNTEEMSKEKVAVTEANPKKEEVASKNTDEPNTKKEQNQKNEDKEPDGDKITLDDIDKRLDEIMEQL
ncbi:MAG: 30S ribosomal protein S6 [Candidatus Spechtbacterales bacterium]